VEPMDPGKIKGPISLTEVADTVIGNLMSGKAVLRLPRAACESGLRAQIANALQMEPSRVLLFQDCQKLSKDSHLDFKSIVAEVLPAQVFPALHIKVEDSFAEYAYYTGWSYRLCVKPSAPDELDEAHAERMRIHKKFSDDESNCSDLCDMSSGAILQKLEQSRCWRKLVKDVQFAKLQENIKQADIGRGFDWDCGSSSNEYTGFFIDVAGHIIQYDFNSYDDG